MVKFKHPWLVQLDVAAKTRVIAKVEHSTIEIAGDQITIYLNMLPLGSYNMLIRMDSLERDWSLVKCKDNTISFLI